jgi:FtsP/CotA-like multicopper oxidase with cupredoxin domain
VVVADMARFAELGLSTERVGDWPDRLRQRGQRVLLVAMDGRVAGFVGFEEGKEMSGQSVLAEAVPTTSITLADGAHFDLRIGTVAKRLGGDVVRMLAYNGSIPGPTLRVRQGSEIVIDVLNEADVETTVHWHGLRLDNRYDGTLATQPAIPVGGRFTYRLQFPDPGVYWYHPHIREDYGQEMGLYGNIVVEPSDAGYWPAVHRELTLALDDILLEGGSVAPFDASHPTYTAMGRFGNLLLVNGVDDASFRARRGEVVRFYLTNMANSRVFNVAIPGARMKLVGGDSGRYERETFVDSLVIAPSERAVVDVLFETPGGLTLEHRTPARTYRLAAITVDEEEAMPSLMSSFRSLRTNAEPAFDRDQLDRYLQAEPDKTLALIGEMNMGDTTASANAESYVCPMHPEVTSAKPDRCSKCGMKLVPAQLVSGAAHGHDMSDSHTGHEHHHAADRFPSGIEWEDDMVDVNRLTTPANMRWKLIDRESGSEGDSIDWTFRVGDRVKIRIVNEMDSDHPMHHPFHVHGAGRFLVLSRDGVAESNRVWKDTVLIPTGQTVDVLLDVTHPGVWMAHCHIAEHHESGMMLRFRVNA